MAHDRFTEAHYFIHQMEKTYHEPALFRYNTNAFLSALKSVVEMTRKELEARGQAQWMKDRKEAIYEDALLSKFSKGRDTVLHQRELVRGSRVYAGLFRWRKPKLTPI